MSACVHPDHCGSDPGAGLRAAVPPGAVCGAVPGGLPQHEAHGEPAAPLCGAGRRQGQDPPPATGAVSTQHTHTPLLLMLGAALKLAWLFKFLFKRI